MKEIVQTIMLNRIESERQRYNRNHRLEKDRRASKMTGKKVIAILTILLLTVTTASFIAVHTTSQSGPTTSVPTPSAPSFNTIVQDWTNTGSYALGTNGPYVTNITGIFPRPDSEIGNCFITPTTAKVYNMTDAEFVLNTANGMPSGGQVQAQLFSTTGNPLSNTCVPNVSTGLIARSLNAISISSSTTGNLTFQFFVFPNFILLNPGTVYAISLRLTACTVCDSNNFWRVATDGNPVTGGVLTFRVGGGNNLFGPMTSTQSGISFYYLNGFIPASYATYIATGSGGGGGSRPYEM